VFVFFDVERSIPIGSVASIRMIRNRVRHDVANPSCPKGQLFNVPDGFC
jgi:hypothetical protein